MYKIISYPPAGIPSGKFLDEKMNSANSDFTVIPNIEQNSQNEICSYIAIESLSHAFVPAIARSFRLVVNMKGT